jgi:predicted dehydrogenase
MRRALSPLFTLGSVLLACWLASAESPPLRLAVVRVDDHAWWFSGFFNEYDEARLERNHARSARRNREVRDVALPLAGARIVKVWDADTARAREFAATFRGVEVAGSLDEAASGIDGVLIVDAAGDGSDHLALARPFLERGIPAFIDKPFAESARSAREIVALARRHGAPLYSDSTLPHVLAKRFGARLAEAGRLTSLIVSGPVTRGGGSIHQAITALALLGSGPASVQSVGDGARDILHIRYADGRLGIAHASDELRRAPEPQYHALLLGESGILPSGPIEPLDFQRGADAFLRAFALMVRTRKAPLSDEQLVEPIRVLEAGRLSQQRGGAVVTLAEVP